MDSTDSLRRLACAFDLSVRAHEGQRRGHGRREPFINHVADVARRVSESPALDEATLLAAVLHDVVEKTDVPATQVEAQFGAEVAGLVAELTDDASLSERERRTRQVEVASSLSDRAKRIKLADKASKLASIAATPPLPWRRRKVREEIEQACRVAEKLGGTDPVLEAAFDHEARRADMALEG